MINIIENIQTLKKDLIKQEELSRQTGRTTRIVSEAIKNNATVVCFNFMQKKRLKEIYNKVKFITVEEYNQQKIGSNEIYLFDHLTIYMLNLKMYDSIMDQYEVELQKRDSDALYIEAIEKEVEKLKRGINSIVLYYNKENK